MTYVAWPIEEFAAFRADVEANVLATMDLAGDLGERVRQGTRVERFRTTPDLPNRVRAAYGPGWALAGDAGLVMDPITGQGIGHAFRDAELLAGALEAGLGGRVPLEAALADYQQRRDTATLAMYRFTCELASFPAPRPEQQALFAALAGDQAETDRFLGVLTGAVPMERYFTPRNLVRLIGLRGLGRMLLGRRGRARAGAGQPVRA
jgi:2-polyprenyl-6-methoxyphenol hydroxylase-like FAD-dependent oxidoreductase